MVTIKDVAKIAGVSVATVSHVFNDTRYVSDKLRKKVKEATERLDYHPNLMAGSLRSRKTKTIGLIIPDNSNPLFAAISWLIEFECAKLGYNLILSNSAYDIKLEKEAIKTLLRKKVDGVIMIPHVTQIETLEIFLKREIPLVIIHHIIPKIKTDTVILDNSKAAYDATKHLIDSGHKRIGYIDRPFDIAHSLNRVDAYKKTLIECDIEVNEDIITRSEGFKYKDGLNTMNILLSRNPLPSAVIAFNDIIAIGAIRAIKDHNLEVPKDISVIGFDDIDVSSYVTPRLSTIHFPKRKMAEFATKFLVNKIKDKAEDKTIKKILKTHLVVRESTSIFKG